MFLMVVEDFIDLSLSQPATGRVKEDFIGEMLLFYYCLQRANAPLIIVTDGIATNINSNQTKKKRKPAATTN